MRYYTKKVERCLLIILIGNLLCVPVGTGIPLLVALGTAAMTYFLSDRDLHAELEKRREEMKQSYSDVVSRLILCMEAGLTIRGSLQKIAKDYEMRKMGLGFGRKSKEIYEEICYTCRELQAGVPEGAAYEHLGKRIGIREYLHLSMLLTQNLKKGNSSLLPRLKEEATRATVEHLQNAKRYGEELSTGLFVPMAMLLAVAMLMIMIPAFSTIGE